ncbi:MAG: sodium-dependent transporter [bacterium]
MAGMQSQDMGDEHWSSRAAFILAAVGSAVGLGNLWRFPYVAGENGGGAFVLVYLLCVILIGLPVLSAELYLGRRGGGSAIAAISRLARSEGKTAAWSIFAVIGMLASFLILSFYSVIAGWVLYFAEEMTKDLIGAIGREGFGAISQGAFAGMERDELTGQLGGLLSNPTQMLIYHGIFIGLTSIIVARGIKGGIEAAVKFLMPAFFVMLIILTIFSLIVGDGAAAATYLFKPDFGALWHGVANGSILLNALGQAFFSIGLGSSLMITYGLYMNKGTDIPGAARIVGLADTGVALLAGLAIFPIVFGFGLEPGAGPGLMFVTLPLAFQQIPFGALFGIAFFIMALFAALTSSISLMEVAIAWADGDIDTPPEVRERKRMIWAAVGGVILFIIGAGNALSQVPVEIQDTFFNTWVPVDWMPLLKGATLLDFLDKITGSIMLPLGGFLTAIFASWIVSKSASREELGFKSEKWYQRWLFLTRWVCPAAVGFVLVWGAFIVPMMQG